MMSDGSGTGQSPLSRREFLRRSGAALAVLAVPRLLPAQMCSPTTTDVFGLGPFYVPDSPVRTGSLNPNVEAGTLLAISGTVSDCNGLLPGARVEVWHADANGCYSGFADAEDCKVAPTDPDLFRMRGTLVADSQGRYGYTTIMPAPYGNPNGQYRTPHIHYRVSLPPESGRSIELITQLYFQGATYVEEDDGAEDALATSGMQRIIALNPRTGGGVEGVFSIVVTDPVANLMEGPRSPYALHGFDVMILREGRDLRFFLPPQRLPGVVYLRVLSISGRVLHKSRHNSREVLWDATLFPAGSYTVELRSSHSKSRESFHIIL